MQPSWLITAAAIVSKPSEQLCSARLASVGSRVAAAEWQACKLFPGSDLTDLKLQEDKGIPKIMIGNGHLAAAPAPELSEGERAPSGQAFVLLHLQVLWAL